jgi:UDP-N-acetylglucosamine acyltransferase
MDEHEVVRGKNVAVHKTAVLTGPLVLEDDVVVHAGAVIGGSAETYDRDRCDSHQKMVIGAGTVIRENVVVQRGVKGGEGTRIGPRCLIMHGSHVAHDCRVHADVIMAPGVILGGHTVVMGGANLGIGAMVHQWAVIGPWSMVGMGAVLLHDVPPGATVVGSPAKVVGENTLGLERGEVDEGRLADAWAAWADIQERRQRMGVMRGVVGSLILG